MREYTSPIAYCFIHDLQKFHACIFDACANAAIGRKVRGQQPVTVNGAPLLRTPALVHRPRGNNNRKSTRRIQILILRRMSVPVDL